MHFAGDGEKNTIRGAFQHLMNETCLVFLELNNEASISAPHLNITKGGRDWWETFTLMCRRKKEGFTVPLKELFRANWGAYVEKFCLQSGSLFSEKINPSVVEELLTAHRKGTADFGYELYCLLVLGNYLSRW